MRLNVPNMLTLARLVLALVCFVLLGTYEQARPAPRLLDTALVLFLIAFATDVLDGMVARWLGQQSAFGRIVDPFVDKVLICGALIFLAGDNFFDPKLGENVTGLSAWIVVVVLLRELVVSALRGFSESRGLSFAASVPGKAKMFAQTVCVAYLIGYVAHGQGAEARWPMALRDVLIWLTLVTTVLSAVVYVGRFADLVKGKRD